jgi:uncharacterized protein YhfF
VSDSMVPETYRGLRSFAFGDSPDLSDELLDLVLKGVKTATCSTEDEPNTSTPGERWVVLDHCGRARSAPSPACGGGLGWGCLRSGDRDG